MKKMFKILGVALFLFLLIGCFAPTEDDIYGNWVRVGSEYKITVSDSIILNESRIFDNDLDDYFSTMFFQFTEDSLINYWNNSEDGTFEREPSSLSIVADTICLGSGLNEMTYAFNGKNELKITISQYSTNNYIGLSIGMIFNRYRRDIPPESWTMPLEDDNYEPDERNCTVLKESKSQKHTLTDDDVDVFSFQAVENTTYLFQVNSNIDVNLTIEDIDGHELAYDDDNDDEITDLDGAVESVIRWTASSSEEIYLLVSSGDLGYYTIEATDEGMHTMKITKNSSVGNTPSFEMLKKSDEFKKMIHETIEKYFK